VPRVHIPTEIRRQVIARAHECCEYCLIHQDDAATAHQVDHVIALKHGGQTNLANLALACQLCNRYKGSDLTTLDRDSRELVPLFNPRLQRWNEHFELASAQIIGLTPTGRATIELLQINDEARLLDRQELIVAGRYPPTQPT
jgi:HNH endonuclease